MIAALPGTFSSLNQLTNTLSYQVQFRVFSPLGPVKDKCWECSAPLDGYLEHMQTIMRLV